MLSMRSKRIHAMNDEKQGFVCKVPSVVLGVLNVINIRNGM